MICPQCAAEGRKSCVYVGSTTQTLLYCPPFYDEEGHYHTHDSNRSSISYECSNGHTWVEETKLHCWCGWPETHITAEEKPC